MDTLGQLRVFTRVVERGSLSRAARDLGVTQPTVSKALSALEARLGQRLLQRTTRTLHVTDAGRRYYARCRAVLEQLEEAGAELSEPEHPRGVLRLHGPVALGELFLAPAAVAFQQRFPQVRCELTLLDSFVDLVAEGADLAIRLGRLEDPSLVRRPLGATRRLLTASPAYLRRAGTPRSPADLRAHACVRFSGLPGGDAALLQAPGGPRAFPMAPGFVSNNATALRHALLGGLGIGLVTEWLVAGELARGRLVEVLPATPPTPLEMHAVFPSARFIPVRARAYVDFLADFLRGKPGMQPAGRTA